MNEHKPKCKCAICEAQKGGLSKEEALAQVYKWEEECIEKYGFYVHYVNEGELVNVHTHGLENFNHQDLQILLPIDPKTAHGVINVVVDKIKKGDVFVDGMVVEGIIHNFSVKFIDAKENDRDILRIILPDSQGKFEQNEISEQFSVQYGIKPKWTAFKPN